MFFTFANHKTVIILKKNKIRSLKTFTLTGSNFELFNVPLLIKLKAIEFNWF